MTDDAVRREVLDPSKSFCLTAPAGSGKTSLLTQRLLALLVTVERPEQVLAITFTRKAAAEMRSRVLEAIDRSQSASAPPSEHEARTHTLAAAVVRHAESRGWALTPETFNIRTIDGLSAQLNQAMPIGSGLGGASAILDDASPLYEEAVDGLYALIGEDSTRGQALRDLVLGMDNDWQRCRELLVILLGRRTDWLRELGQHNTAEESARTLTRTLQTVISAQLALALETLDQHWLAEAASEASSANQRLRTYVAEGIVDSGSATVLACETLCLTENVQSLAHWQWFVRWALTGDKTPRKRLTKNEGYNASTDKAAKTRALALINRLADAPQALTTLKDIASLPNPDISDDEWSGVIRLSRVLPSLAAQLLTVFQRHSGVDHAHIAMAAEAALGDEEAPTDLALRLDYQLQHLLVDEFQDTSIGQFRLLEKLCRGWSDHNHIEPTHPRTLFIVGDAMQSIYGFRYADVSLFLQAREKGIAGVALCARELNRNFRSQGGVIDWVNAQFSELLPESSNARLGAVPLTKAQAIHPALPGPAVETHCFPDDVEREIEFVCDRVEELLREEDQTRIAILGRTRPAIAPVSAALTERGIDIIGADLTPFVHRPAINDLMCVIRWLANPADDIALMGLLRAPMVGCTLEDLGGFRSQEHLGSVQAMQTWVSSTTAAISRDGRRRLEHVLSVLAWAESKRDRLNMSAWVEQTWLKLGGLGVISPNERPDTDAFFDQLRIQERAGVALDLRPITHWFETRYSTSESDTARVELMTLHKSKGLEYDHVFIVGAARSGRADPKPLLRWSRDPAGLLIAAQPVRNTKNSLYDYLGHVNTSQQRQELIRLFYVGITRAKRTCVLTATRSSEKVWPPNQTSSFWSAFCAAAGSDVTYHEVRNVSEPDKNASDVKVPPFARRALHSLPAVNDNSIQTTETGDTGKPNLTSNLISRRYGIAMHKALEQLVAVDPLPVRCSTFLKQTMALQLRIMGSRRVAIEVELAQLETSINRVLQDPTARWILSAEHEDASSELRLWQSEEGREIVIDRTFIDVPSQTRWIIDYKTSRPEGDESLSAFTAREAQEYSDQLQRYCHALTRYDLGAGRAPQAWKAALYFTEVCVFFPVPLLGNQQG